MSSQKLIEPTSSGVRPARSSDPPPTQSSHWWIWLLVLCILAGAAFGAYQFGLFQRLSSMTTPDARAAGSQTGRSVPVVAVPARRGDLQIYLTELGTATALNSVTVRTRVDGQLMKVAFTEGQTVQAGELLAEIDPRPFQVQLEQAQGQMARDQAALQNAKLDQARYETAREAVSQQQLDTSKAQVTQFEGAVKVDQSQVDSANLQLTYCRITAPFTGVIGLRQVDQGNIVHASDANGLAVITQVEPITVTFSVSEDDLPQVLKASRNGGGGEGGSSGSAGLVVEAYNRDRRIKLATGKLLAVDSQIDPTNAMIRIKAIFENKDRALYPNQFVNVRLLVDTRKGAVLIPAAAVQQSPQTTFVYVAKPDPAPEGTTPGSATGTVEMRPITVGPTQEDSTAVDQGLEAGELVVTDGVDKLVPGMKVQLRSTNQPVQAETPRTRGSR